MFTETRRFGAGTRKQATATQRGGSRTRMAIASIAAVMILLQAISHAQMTPGGPGIAAGNRYGLFRMPDGTAKSWGMGNNGALGLGNTAHQSLPQTIPGLSNVASVAAGDGCSLALLSDGTVTAWGGNGWGVLGNGTTTGQSLVPVSIAGLTGVTRVSLTNAFCLALLTDGSVKSWGYAWGGALGLGVNAQATPTAVPNLTNVVQVHASSTNSRVLLNDGTVKTCGMGGYGANGLGASTSNISTFAPVPGLNGVTQLAGGYQFGLALLSDGTVKAWGLNSNGQLGLGDNVNRNEPTLVPGLTNVQWIAAGSDCSFAVLADGTVRSWGNNTTGQLGIGNTTAQNTPQVVPGLDGVTELSCASNTYAHTLAKRTEQLVAAWGMNSNGQLGLGSSGSNQLFAQNVCIASSGASYQLQIAPVGVLGVGFLIPCNTEVGALGPGHYYFNTFGVDPANASSPGTGPWHGLHITQAEVFTWLDAGINGLALAFGPLSSTGGASASIAVPPTLLAGITLYGVSIALNPLTGQVVADSNVASHTF